MNFLKFLLAILNLDSGFGIDPNGFVGGVEAIANQLDPDGHA